MLQTAAAANSESSSTSRLSHDRRRLRSAFHAATGRPRCNIAPSRLATASPAAARRSGTLLAPNAIEQLAPTAIWLTRVSQTSGQCGCSGRRFQSLAAYVSTGTDRGSSIRVVEIVSPLFGSCGASAS